LARKPANRRSQLENHAGAITQAHASHHPGRKAVLQCSGLPHPPNIPLWILVGFGHTPFSSFSRKKLFVFAACAAALDSSSFRNDLNLMQRRHLTCTSVLKLVVDAAL
jgi:hypothetical protein